MTSFALFLILMTPTPQPAEVVSFMSLQDCQFAAQATANHYKVYLLEIHT